ncbi:hypothetical protein ACWIUD_09900 [Helicobacter sp. 23-1044]
MMALNRSTQILIDNFINTNFSNIPSENRTKIKNDFVEIADSILEQNGKDLDKLATKADLKDLKDEFMLLKNNIDKVESKLEVKIAEIKSDLLRWLLTTQIAIVGLLFALIKLTQN